MDKLNTDDHLLKNAVSGSFTMDEVKSLLWYGQEKRDGKVQLTEDKRHLDWAMYRMMDSLDDSSLNRESVEKLFWDRLLALANYR
jgi:hypothetical protein